MTDAHTNRIGISSPGGSSQPRVFIAADASTVVGGYLLLSALRLKGVRWALGLLFIGMPLVGLAWMTGWITVVFVITIAAMLACSRWDKAEGWRQGAWVISALAFGVWIWVWLIAMLVTLMHAGN
jgi:hypothetical protein